MLQLLDLQPELEHASSIRVRCASADDVPSCKDARGVVELICLTRKVVMQEPLQRLGRGRRAVSSRT